MRSVAGKPNDLIQRIIASEWQSRDGTKLLGSRAQVWITTLFAEERVERGKRGSSWVDGGKSERKHREERKSQPGNENDHFGPQLEPMSLQHVGSSLQDGNSQWRHMGPLPDQRSSPRGHPSLGVRSLSHWTIRAVYHSVDEHLLWTPIMCQSLC